MITLKRQSQYGSASLLCRLLKDYVIINLVLNKSNLFDGRLLFAHASLGTKWR